MCLVKITKKYLCTEHLKCGKVLGGERCTGEQDIREEGLASGSQGEERYRPYMEHALSDVQSSATSMGIRQDGLYSMTGAKGSSAVHHQKCRSL